MYRISTHSKLEVITEFFNSIIDLHFEYNSKKKVLNDLIIKSVNLCFKVAGCVGGFSMQCRIQSCVDAIQKQCGSCKILVRTFSIFFYRLSAVIHELIGNYDTLNSLIS